MSQVPFRHFVRDLQQEVATYYHALLADGMDGARQHTSAEVTKVGKKCLRGSS